MNQDCKSELNKTRKSELNETYIIKEEEWVISLARKTDNIFTQHAFIILEAIEDQKNCIYFIDFVGKGIMKLSNSKIGFIRLCRYEELEDTEKLLYLCDRKMMDIGPNDKAHSQQWYISKDDAEKLIQIIKNEKKNQPYSFNILGKTSVLAQSSGDSSGKEAGHSCFTWAKEKLLDVNIKVQGSDTVEWINKVANITGLTIVGPNSFWKPFLGGALVGGGLVCSGVAVAHVISKQESSPKCSLF